jgi:hypothetical protein
MWLWLLSTAAVVLLVFAIAFGFLVVLALAVIAPEINVWPLIGSLILGLVLALAGLVLANRKPRSRVAVIVNMLAAVCHAGGLVLITIPVFSAVDQHYIMAEGYMGDVVIIYGIEQGAPKQTVSGTLTYEIPENGILVTAGQPVRTWVREKYFYRRSDGSRKEIDSKWNTTIHDTPENRADPSIGISMGGGIGVMTSPKCRIEFHSFIVGTKDSILTHLKASRNETAREAQRVACLMKTSN